MTARQPFNGLGEGALPLSRFLPIIEDRNHHPSELPLLKEQKSMKNMNELAIAVTLDEGHKVSLSIAQVKEVLRIVSIRLVLDPMVGTLLVKNGNRIIRTCHKKKKIPKKGAKNAKARS